MPAGLTLGKVTVNGTDAVTVAFLCRVPDKRHSAKRALPINFLPCVLCRVPHSAKALPSAIWPLPSASGTRQRTWIQLWYREIKKTFEYLKERVWKRIQGWKEKLLSKAGKGVLIKAIAQAIPSYAMSCFDLTKSLCDEISSMISRFWWA